jgi:hypothetical protein
MVTKQNQNNDGQVDRVRSGLQWLGTMIREVKFGTIRGVLIRDGLIVNEHRPSVIRTGKPRGRGSPGHLASVATLNDALRDLANDIISKPDEGKLEIKIAHGTILSWDIEHSGCSVSKGNK